MKRYFLLFCMLININLTAHDTNTKSTEKLPEMLQALEQQIKEQKEEVGDLQVYTTYTPWLVIPGGIGFGLSCRYLAPRTLEFGVSIFCLTLCAIGITGIVDRFITLPEEQKELEALEKNRAALLKKLKEKEDQRN